MKKLLVAMLVALLCVPSMAAVSISAAGGENVMTITVTVTGDDEVRGMAVEVTQTADDTGDMAIANDGTDFSVAVDGFNTFIDYANTAGSGYTEVGLGHPIAELDAAGAMTVADGIQDFAVCAGYLDEDDDETLGEGLGEGTYTITIDMTGTADTQFDVALDTTRGGVVGDIADDVDDSGLGTITVEYVADECIPSTHADYAEWVAVGKPDSWCYESQCYGDADGTTEKVGKKYYTVTNADLQILIEGYVTEYSGDPEVDTWIAADFSRTEEKVGKKYYRVSNEDLQILIENYVVDDVPTDCND